MLFLKKLAYFEFKWLLRFFEKFTKNHRIFKTQNLRERWPANEKWVKNKLANQDGVLWQFGLAGHLYWCLLMSSFRVNTFPHALHVHTFSPVCSFSCLLRLSDLVNLFIISIYYYFSTCILACLIVKKVNKIVVV